MKKQSIIILIVLASVILLFPSLPGAADQKKAKITVFSGTRYQTEQIYAGFQWGTDDDVQNVRDREVLWEWDTDEPLATGIQTLIINTCMNPPPNSNKPEGVGNQNNWGSLWGTFTMDIDEDQEPDWVGTLYGFANADGYWYQNYIAEGIGELSGLRLYGFSGIIEPDLPGAPPLKTWSVTGYIIDYGYNEGENNDDEEDEGENWKGFGFGR